MVLGVLQVLGDHGRSSARPVGVRLLSASWPGERNEARSRPQGRDGDGVALGDHALGLLWCSTSSTPPGMSRARREGARLADHPEPVRRGQLGAVDDHPSRPAADPASAASANEVLATTRTADPSSDEISTASAPASRSSCRVSSSTSEPTLPSRVADGELDAGPGRRRGAGEDAQRLDRAPRLLQGGPAAAAAAGDPAWVSSRSRASALQPGRPLGDVVEDAHQVGLPQARRARSSWVDRTCTTTANPSSAHRTARQQVARLGGSAAAAVAEPPASEPAAPRLGTCCRRAHALNSWRRMAAALEKMRMPSTTTTPVDSCVPTPSWSPR